MSASVAIHEPPTETVLEAIKALYNSQGAQREQADKWLKEFQRTTYAWKFSDQVLRADSMPYEELLFSAQNLRSKILFDLVQLDMPAKEALKDSLLHLIVKYKAGPRAVSRYISLALADLAILMPEWESPIDQMSYLFTNSNDVYLLLLFLTALPEECSRRKQSTVELDFLSERRVKLLDANAVKVLNMLMMILNSEIPDNLRKEALDCLYSWIRTGIIQLPMLQGTNVVDKAFEALSSDYNFEVGVDLVCCIIEECGNYVRRKSDTSHFMETVHNIYKSLQVHLQAMRQCEDEEALRGYCRVFATAGEAFRNLIAGNLEAWKGIIDGLLVCAENSELEIVSMTFLFWGMLTEVIQNQPKEPFLYIFRRLMDGMITHLHYPDDESVWTGKQRDEFSDFRHKVGDVLKDCVEVLGPEEAILKPYQLLKNFSLATANGTLDPNVRWQSVEAPLFAIRVMGDRIREKDNPAFAEIMSMLPQLPSHPKVKYAAILVIGRYAHWTKLHPEFLPYQMTYVSKGFEDNESIAAASRALKYLCNECGERIVDYLGQLHPFYLSITNKLENFERRDLTEALAHVIKHVPLSTPEGGQPNLMKVLEMFCLPIAQRLHEIGALIQVNGGDGDTSVNSLQKEAASLITQFSIFIDIVDIHTELGENNPAVLLFRHMWPILAGLMDLNNATITSAVCKPLNLFAKKYYPHNRFFLPDLFPKLASSYAADPMSSCLLWIASVYVQLFGDEREGHGQAMYQLVESMSKGAFEVIQANPKDVDRTIEDYFLLLSVFVEKCPSLFVQSPLVSSFIKCGIACIKINEPNAWISVATRFFRNVFKLASPIWRERRIASLNNITRGRIGAPDGSNLPPSTPSTSPSRSQNTSVVPPPIHEQVEPLISLLRLEAPEFFSELMNGMIYTLPLSDHLSSAESFDRTLEQDLEEDEPYLGRGAALSFVGTIFLLYIDAIPQGEAMQAFHATIAQLPCMAVTGEERQRLLTQVQKEVDARSAKGLERVLTRFSRVYETKSADEKRAANLIADK
ncbi:Nuclear import receptor [Phlyctochytrium planicorne]|nr:Nuclear import receptor [Phlyctochytrium planicorne]